MSAAVARSTARTPTTGRRAPIPKRYSRAALFGVVAGREAWRDAGLRVGEPGAGVIIGSGGGGIDVGERQYHDFFTNGGKQRHALRHCRRHLRHGVERDLDLARPARHQPRALDRLHLVHRRDRLRRGAAARRRRRRAAVGRHRRLRAAGHDLRLLAHARRLDPLQRSAGRGLAPVRPRPRRLRARRRRVDGGARARGPGARARGAHVYATVDGYASTCDAYHRVQMDPDGDEIVRCMQHGGGEVGPRARRDRLRELPRHVDAAERRGRGALHAARVRPAAPIGCRARRPSR